MISNVPIPAMTYIFMGITTLVLTYITFLDDGNSEEKKEEDLNPEEESNESEYNQEERELEEQNQEEREQEEQKQEEELNTQIETEKKEAIQGGKKNRTKINKLHKKKKSKRTIKHTRKTK